MQVGAAVALIGFRRKQAKVNGFLAELIDSLDEAAPAEAGVEEVWAAEVERRLADVDSGAVKPVPWSEARRRILAATRGEREIP
jgi:putative addiction module component (TIGR02574 family)